MLVKVFSIYDSKVEAFMRPFFEQTRGSAIRSVTEAVNDKSTSFSKYPADFTLFELGSFDDSNGQFTLLPTPVSCGLLIEFVDVDDRSRFSDVRSGAVVVE